MFLVLGITVPAFADVSTEMFTVNNTWISSDEFHRFVRASGNDSRTRKYCMLAGERHLVVPAYSEAKFKRTLREVGYLVAMVEVKSAKPRRKASSMKPAS